MLYFTVLFDFCSNLIFIDESIEIVERLKRQISAIKSNLRKEYLFEAYRQIEELDSFLYIVERDRKAEVPSEVYDFVNGEQASRARNDMEVYLEYIDHIEDFSRDWELYDNSKYCKIYNKPRFEDDVTSFTFGGDCIVDYNLFRPCSMMGEYQKLPDWIPTLASVDVLKEQSCLKRLIHLKIDLPIMFTNRDLVLEGTGFINVEEKSVCFLLRSFFEDSFFGVNVDSECEGRLRMDMKHGFLYIKHIDDNK